MHNVQVAFNVKQKHIGDHQYNYLALAYKWQLTHILSQFGEGAEVLSEPTRVTETH